MNEDTQIPVERDETVQTQCRSSPRSSFLQSSRRVMLATLVAVPSTGILAAAMLLVPANVAMGIGVSGIVLFLAGKGLNRPILLAIGGVVMFAGVLSWAVRQ